MIGIDIYLASFPLIKKTTPGLASNSVYLGKDVCGAATQYKVHATKVYVPDHSPRRRNVVLLYVCMYVYIRGKLCTSTELSLVEPNRLESYVL